MEFTATKSQLAKIIRERRAVKKGYNHEEVKEETVFALLQDAIWAPNHGMRQPWRFIFVGQDRRPDFAKKLLPLILKKNNKIGKII